MSAWPIPDEVVEAARFWSKVDVGAPNACWEWRAARRSNGYGVFSVGAGVSDGAHRVAWVISRGTPVPDGMMVCHTCDNRGCVNPAHLWVGTAMDNMSDRSRKGRTVGTKLFPELVRQVRHLAERPDTSHQQIADRIGVSHHAIYSVLRGRTWGHVPQRAPISMNPREWAAAKSDPREPPSPGDEVRWVSQSRGYVNERRGVVLGFVPAGTDVREFCDHIAADSRIMVQRSTYVSGVDRYAVEVELPNGLPAVYAPRASALERVNAAA